MDGFELQQGRMQLAPAVWAPAEVIQFRFDRSSGPGGQNVNKLATRATLTVDLVLLEPCMPAWAYRRLIELAGSRFADDPPRLVMSAGESRSQLANKKACLARLRALLLEAMNRPKVRRATKPSRGAIERRLRHKKHRSQIKQLRRGKND